MSDNLPTHTERTDAVMARLEEALDPHTPTEAHLVDWFRRALDLAHLEALARMVERARRDAWPR
jgi:energy-converting hydrogenase A subunit M